LYFTDVKQAINVSLDKAFTDLFDRLIPSGQHDDNETLKTDIYGVNSMRTALTEWN